MTGSGLGARADALERLSASSNGTPFDVLVVGGGITGAGIALDAASRGMKVALVERGDFASGTSSKSSKLVHGGLRYLEQREFGLVREASVERDLMLRLAPHLVEPIPFVLPVSGRTMRAKFGAGLWAYDALASFRNLRVHKHLTPDEATAMVPPMPADKLKGGYLFYDCKTDDVRLVMETLVQAVRYGAVVCNYASVVGLTGGETCAAAIRDERSGDSFEILARRVVVAAGVWGDRVEHLANPEVQARLRPSKGVHLVLPSLKLPMGEAAAFIPDAERRRMLFVIPWLDSILIGTTDTAFAGDLDDPFVEDDDRAYCLNAINESFGLSLSDADISGAYAGLRPLVAGAAGETADLSRRHRVYDIAEGITGITGGKLTTWRRMAKDAVDRVAEELSVTTKCKTHWIRLGSSNVPALRLAVARRAQRLRLQADVVDNLVRCYGDRAMGVLDSAEAHSLTSRVVEGQSPITAEAAYCVANEMVVSLSDFLSRRTRLSLTDRAAGIGVSSNALDAVGEFLAWSRKEKQRQVAAHLAAVERERGIPIGPEEQPFDPDERAATG